MANERRFVLVVTPAYVKPIHDGSKVVIIYPGASQEELEKLRAAVEDLKTKPDLHVCVIAPDNITVEWIQVERVRELRGE